MGDAGSSSAEGVFDAGDASDGAGSGAGAGDGVGDAADARGEDVDRTELSNEQIDAVLDQINPKFDPTSPGNGFATNCGHTSSILNDVLNGRPVREAPGGSTLSMREMAVATGRPQTRATPEQIEATLRAGGAGSHCVVGIHRSSGAGHWFNAYFDGTDVWALDAQTGARSPWPPHEPNATNWDASIDRDALVNADGTSVYEVKPDAAAGGAAGGEAGSADAGGESSPSDASSESDASSAGDASSTDASSASDGSGAGDARDGADAAGHRDGADAEGSPAETPEGRNQRRMSRLKRLIERFADREHIARFFRGEIFNVENHHWYPINELHVTRPGQTGGPYVRADSVVPGGEVVSRKFTQLGQVGTGTVRSYIREITEKYGMTGADGDQILVADTPSNRRDLEAAGLDPDDHIGRPMEGERYLEVPRQDEPPRAEDLAYAADQDPPVIVRDVEGTIWQLENGNVVEKRADGETIVHVKGQMR